MTLASYAILIGGALFVASRLVRIAHLWQVVRTIVPPDPPRPVRSGGGGFPPDGDASLDGDSDADQEDSEVESVGIALALALREAENEARGIPVDKP